MSDVAVFDGNGCVAVGAQSGAVDAEILHFKVVGIDDELERGGRHIVDGVAPADDDFVCGLGLVGCLTPNVTGADIVQKECFARSEPGAKVDDAGSVEKDAAVEVLEFDGDVCGIADAHILQFDIEADVTIGA